jgi:hypothetical protein
MKQSLSLFFILLCIYTLSTITGVSGAVQTTQGASHTYPSKQTPQPSTHDEWLDFDDEDEEQKTMQPKTRWQRFMGGVDKFALQMKALWAFKIKPWWKEKHGKEITIATASTLATLVAAWMMYRKIKKVKTVLDSMGIRSLSTERPEIHTNPCINPFARSLGKSSN